MHTNPSYKKKNQFHEIVGSCLLFAMVMVIDTLNQFRGTSPAEFLCIPKMEFCVVKRGILKGYYIVSTKKTTALWTQRNKCKRALLKLASLYRCSFMFCLKCFAFVCASKGFRIEINCSLLAFLVFDFFLFHSCHLPNTHWKSSCLFFLLIR